MRLPALVLILLASSFGCNDPNDRIIPFEEGSIERLNEGGSRRVGLLPASDSRQPSEGTTTLTITVSQARSPAEAHSAAKDVLLLGLELKTTAAVEVSRLDVSAVGTGDESADVEAARLLEDVNQNGAYDSGADREIATIQGFSADDGTASFAGFNEPLTAGATVEWFVLYDFSGSGTPGTTFKIEIADATAVRATDKSGKTVAVQSLPATGNTVALYQNTHLLISEVAVKPTAAEFIELYNPTAKRIDLADVYLTDGATPPNATTGEPGKYYYKIVTGKDMGGGLTNMYDFHVRFPKGATVEPNEFVTIAPDGSAFNMTYGFDPTFELAQDGTGDGIEDMIPVVPGAVGTMAGLTNQEESVVLYQWDGASDLVQDLDYVQYWDVGGSGVRHTIDKTGVSVDGPDADSQASTYKDDDDPFLQDRIQAHLNGNSLTRIDFGEGTEVETNGNGVGGHNETSENLSITFDPNKKASPGTKQ